MSTRSSLLRAVTSPSDSQPGASSSLERLEGTSIADRYRLIQLLGEGGMGVVYRGEHVMMQKPVAIKILHPELAASAEAQQRFEREAIAAGRIRHPHVVAATDFGVLPSGARYLVLDYVDGESLGALLEREGPLPVARALDLCRQIVTALEAAHAAGIVHRDLKPDNVLLVAEGERKDFVKVLDFGIAKLQHADADERTLPQLTKMGAVFGTPEYMSPEQAAGKPADARADLYALGIILFEMLEGQTPFVADELLVILTRQLTEPAPELRRAVDEELRIVIRRLLEKEPERRFQSATELLHALERVRAGASSRRRGFRFFGASREWFTRAHRVGRYRVYTWQFAVGVFALGALGAALVVAATRLPAATFVAAALVSEPEKPSLEQLHAAALLGDPAALSALLELPEESRGAETWLALARGFTRTGRTPDALGAYDRALALDSSHADDPELLSVLLGASRAPELGARVVTLAAERLGAEGADLLFQWQEGEDSPVKEGARQALAGSARERASPALDVALRLGEAKTCQAFKALLPQAIQHADTRSSAELAKRLNPRGCGFLRLNDCHPCLRGREELRRAIAAAKARPAPIFGAPQQPP